MRTANRKTICIRVAIFLVAVFCCPGILAHGYADDYQTFQVIDGNVLYYTQSDDGSYATIQGRQTNADDENLFLEIPRKLNGTLPVKTIGDGAFENDTALTKVSLRSGVTKIGSRAFANCNYLKEIYIPESVVSIADDAFDGCIQVKIIGETDSVADFYASKHDINFEGGQREKEYVYTDEFGTEITYSVPDLVGKAVITGRIETAGQDKMHIPAQVPDPDYPLGGHMIKVERITDNAFAADSGLREVIISDGIQDLRGGIFMWCANLKEVALPEGLTRLPYNTFRGCTSLERVSLPSTLQELDPTSFDSCKSFKEFVLAEGNSTFYLEDGVLFSGVKEDELSKLVYYPPGRDGTDYVIPDGVRQIGRLAFLSSSLESITLPEGMFGVGYGAFKDCTNLKEVHFCARAVLLDDEDIFNGCDDVLLYVYKGSVALDYAKRNGFRYEIVNPGEPNPPEPGQYNSISNEDGYVFYTDYPCGETGPSMDGVTVIKITGWRDETASDAMVSLDIPKAKDIDSYREIQIGENAFEGNKKIYSVVIGDGCTYIGSRAFADCPNLHKVYVPPSVTGIADDAFEGSDCVVLYGEPGSYVLDYAITQAISVANANDEVYEYIDENGTHITYTIPDLLGKAVITGVRSSSTGPIKIHVPAEVPTIGAETIPSMIPVDRIQKGAFSGLNNLTEAVISDGIKTMGTSCFSECTSLREVTLPEGLQAVPSGTFFGCTALEKVHFPSTLSSMTGAAFMNCTSLQGIDVAANNDHFFFDDGVLYGGKRGDDHLTLAYYPLGREGTTFDVSEKVSNIGEFAFFQSQLQAITLPESLTEISDSAFNDCSRLTSMRIPSGVQEIGRCAFYQCSSLNKVEFDRTCKLQELQGSTFAYCSALEEINIPDTIKTIGVQAFHASGLSRIVIPASVTAIQSSAFQDCRSLSTVTFAKGTDQMSIDVEAFSKTAIEEIFLPFRIFIRPGYGPFSGMEDQVTLRVERNSSSHQYAEKENIKYIIVDANGDQVQTINGKTSFTKVYGSSAFSLGAKAKTNLTYVSSNKAVAVVSSTGKVTLKGPGTATITIKAKRQNGFAAATKKVTIKCTLKKPALTAVNLRGGKVKLTWSKVTGADGYKVYICVPGSSKYICRLTKSAHIKSVTHRGLTKGKVYKYKVRAFAKVGKKTVYSPYSTIQKVRIRR